MLRRATSSLVAGLIGGAALLALWWPVLAVLALLIEGTNFFSARLGAFLASPIGVILVALLPALGLIHGGILGAVRGRLSGPVLVEVLAAPFAWIVTAGEGMIGGIVMVLSLLPGACVGALIGMLIAGTPTSSKAWPDEAATGALLGVGLSLIGLNLYVQWPSLTGKEPVGRGYSGPKG